MSAAGKVDLVNRVVGQYTLLDQSMPHTHLLPCPRAPTSNVWNVWSGFTLYFNKRLSLISTSSTNFTPALSPIVSVCPRTTMCPCTTLHYISHTEFARTRYWKLSLNLAKGVRLVGNSCPGSCPPPTQPTGNACLAGSVCYKSCVSICTFILVKQSFVLVQKPQVCISTSI